ncbi:anti-sigma factor [Aquimarina brevivitae]|uniref:Anti-sigma-K factor rskA n=1 Tax=Aquimarina brevivitae TaxID=323412 RepID=A0A4Q7P1B9_9FLAO|nr:anti-sigma factor [Aquimarina brevivitae]RZS93357.1 anti-sigma-K factor rskA [Aquimarina brevivitae]
MDIKEYIESGILELYIYGSLSAKENEEVYEMLQKHPEILVEVEKIEATLDQLSAASTTKELSKLYDTIAAKIEANEQVPVRTLARKRSNLPAYIGWAASIALLVGLLSQINKNNKLREEIVSTQIKNQVLEGEISVKEENLKSAENLLSILRNKDIIEVPLNAQAVDPSAYATVYWDKEKDLAYIDVQGLPAPPPGKVYQVWSLKLQPLTPTSLGILEAYKENKNKVFTVENTNDSEAFGITLEPEGGSESPTLEMLYTLGAVES